MDVGKVLGAGVAERFRFLANEFLEARRLPKEEIETVKMALVRQANVDLRIAFPQGHFSSIKCLRNLSLNESISFYDPSIRFIDKTATFEQLAGYSTPYSNEIDVESIDDLEDWERDLYKTKTIFWFACGGILALERLVPRNEVLLGKTLRGEKLSGKKLNVAMFDKRFQILGFYSRACRVLSEIILKECEASDDGDAGGSACVDGVYRSDALLIWGGVRYEWLTDTMMDAIELLVKRYPGRVTPSEMENKIGRLPDGGFKKVFKFNRGGKTGMHPVVSLISGRHPQGWSLKK